MINKILGKFGFKITRKVPPDIDSNFIEMYDIVKDFTMISIERLNANYQAVQYVESNNIEGSIVECGVWKGGSSMLMAMALKNLGNTDREFYMYDTYEGMSTPSENDKDFKGNLAEELMDKENRFDTSKENVWCYFQLEGVKENMHKTGYPLEKINFVKGLVEETIPEVVPEKIAVLRLDTDFYESTKHEMEHLFDKLVPGGVLIIDDYGHWVGARKAIDDYIKNNNVQIMLQRIDYSGRIAIKQ